MYLMNRNTPNCNRAMMPNCIKVRNPPQEFATTYSGRGFGNISLLPFWGLLCITLLLLTSSIHAETIKGEVTRVFDADTIVISSVRIRLADIDAPELSQSCKIKGHEWPCGADMQRYLERAILGQPVECDVEDTDRYGRTVATCYLKDININKMLVERGAAVSYYSKRYFLTELKARWNDEGIWKSDFIMPSQYRKMKKR